MRELRIWRWIAGEVKDSHQQQQKQPHRQLPSTFAWTIRYGYSAKAIRYQGDVTFHYNPADWARASPSEFTMCLNVAGCKVSCCGACGIFVENKAPVNVASVGGKRDGDVAYTVTKKTADR